jgi:integrase/recombinase XerD
VGERQELAQLKVKDIVEREGRTVIINLVGKRRRIRTVAVPCWVKQSVGQWTAAAGITEGPLLRPVSKSGKVGEAGLGAWSVWSLRQLHRRGRTSSPSTVCRLQDLRSFQL